MSIEELVMRFEKVFKKMGNDVVLGGISLEISRGEYLVIRGRSGVGKTTLAKLAALITRPDKGRIFFMNREVSGLGEKQRARIRLKYIGYIDQFFALIPTLTILENVTLPLRLMGHDKASSVEEALKILGELGIGDKVYKVPSQLSGGERQRAAIARALVKHPLLIVGDEPFSNLDDETMNHVVDVIREYVREKKASALVTTTDLVTNYRADKYFLLRNTRLVPA